MSCSNCRGHGCGECLERLNREGSARAVKAAERRSLGVPKLPSPVTRDDFLRGVR